MILCVILLWPSKIKHSLILMKNVFNVWALRANCLKILFLEDMDWIQVFLKNFSSYTHAFYSLKQCALRSFCIKMLCFFKNLFFLDFRSTELVAQLIENAIRILVTICLARLVLDRSRLKVPWFWCKTCFNV